MANNYMGLVNVDQLSFLDDTTGNVTKGTSSTAGDKIELRMDSAVTRFQAVKALEFFIRRLKTGGDAGVSDGSDMGNP